MIGWAQQPLLAGLSPAIQRRTKTERRPNKESLRRNLEGTRSLRTPPHHRQPVAKRGPDVTKGLDGRMENWERRFRPFSLVDMGPGIEL